MIHRGTLVLLLLVTPWVAGCQVFAAMSTMWGKEPMKKVPAEYADLAGRKLCIVVWVEMDTLFEFPQVQYELSQHIRAAMTGPIKGLNFVENRDVVDFQRQNTDWDRMDPAEIGRRFDADRVLSVEVTRYATREPDSPHVYRGRIAANIKVYDAAATGSEPVRLNPVETLYPPDGPTAYGVDDAAVRLNAMAEFGRDVALKFHDHEVPK